MAKIYFIEDDEDIRNLVLYALSNSNSFDAHGFAKPSLFWQQMNADMKESVPPDLVLLDIMLPEEDGVSILRKLKVNQATRLLPVIMVTAKNSEIDRVKGLDYGADDYVTKPFSVLELISRIKAVLRRSEAFSAKSVDTDATSSVFSAGSVSLDSLKHIVTVEGDEVKLTLKEFALLELLLENGGIVMSREKILFQIWDIDFEGETRTVDMHIKTLRQKLGDAGNIIKTIRGIGYKVDA
jgi:two-component system alkaline phosphatase synthesis response regulator PhoP